jgi:hypothetical protein
VSERSCYWLVEARVTRAMRNRFSIDFESFNNIRYGLVARISRSQTVLPRTIRSEEAGVQFPVSESSFAFCSVGCRTFREVAQVVERRIELVLFCNNRRF